jgi:diguanylate cyclase (GGDEF)-like protein
LATETTAQSDTTGRAAAASAAWQQGFLQLLPQRLEHVRGRGRRLLTVGWDINALALLLDDLRLLRTAAARAQARDAAAGLARIEQLLAPCFTAVRPPSAEEATAYESALDALTNTPAVPTSAVAAAGERTLTPGAAAREIASEDGIPLFVAPPHEFIARFAKPVLAIEQIEEPSAVPALVENVPATPIPTVVAPAAPSPNAAAPVLAPTAPAPARAATTAGAGAARRVYHLSDASALSSEIDQRLEALGCQIELLESPEELREMVHALTPQLVLVDASWLDAVDDIGQAVRAARTRASQRVALIVLSSENDVATRLKAMRAGADSFLGLPLQPGEIVARAQELLDADAEEPYRVMIIEDDRSQALFAESILRKAGIRTVAVLDPLAALDTLDSFDPELILMDLYMPNCDGMELTALIREREHFVNTPIVFLSGEHDSDKRFDALSAGGDDYLEKPIRPKYLISAVTNRVRRARALNRRVATQNPRDATTGLYTRGFVIDRIGAALGDESGTNLGGVLFVIIDGAQAIRERIGLTAFDTLLNQAGALLTSLVGGMDFAARYGDTSFLVLAPGHGEQALVEFGEQIRARFERHVFEIGERSLTLAVSIGAAPRALGWSDPTAMINAAERACSLARQTPERKVRLFEPSAPATEPASEGDTLLGDLADALRFDRFQLLYQPIASLHGASDEQFQALLRLRGSGGKLHTASEIVPVAERAGQIGAIDRWTVARALLVLQERDRVDRPLRLFVSQSIEVLRDEGRVEWLRKELDRHGVAADRLVLEFRFADTLPRVREAQSGFALLRGARIGVALSGFEASMSAFQLLQHLAIDYLKLAGRYVLNLDHGARSELAQIVTFAHERQIKVIAPLVEDAQTAAVLWTAGVDFIQGDFVQRAAEDLDFDFKASAI